MGLCHFQQCAQLEDEELPDEMNLTTSTVSDQECQQRDNDSEEYWLMKTEQTEAEMSSLQQPEVFVCVERMARNTLDRNPVDGNEGILGCRTETIFG